VSSLDQSNASPSPGIASLQSRFEWWQGALIYQIYPRSYLDTNGDGVGDLPGIIEKLDYIASLGVEAIWISPFFKSPMADYGYDISDYRAVDPLFGTLADFDRLLAKAHALGLRVMIDQVPSHTSNEHAWFRESRMSRDNPKADWYVWAEARADGSPPNNWLSIFGGSAWKWEPRRAQYYLHNFLVEQPDLNFHCPAVREAVLADIRFWLERGVDGLRLDAINFCFYDRQLRDNPPKPAAARTGQGFRPDNPYAYQYHHFDNTQPENLQFLAELRALTDRFPGRVTLGEIGTAEDSNATIAEYTMPGRLHMGYSFELLGKASSPAHVRATVEGALAHSADAWPCWALSNHDVERVLSRWGGARADASLATLFTALACSLRGAVCIYQGEELGLGEAEIPYEQMRDPYGIAFWPTFKGRDGCRTPIPWTADTNGGFSKTTPWLPVPATHLAQSVASQERAPDSPLNAFRRLLAWRRTQPALLWGQMHFLYHDESLLVFERRLPEQALLVAFNLSDQPANVDLPAAHGATAIPGHGLPAGTIEGTRIMVPAYGAAYARLAR
jgi:alpha-glucosidase